MNFVRKILSALMEATKRAVMAVVRKPVALVRAFVKSFLFSVLMLLAGITLGFLVGARMFEVGMTKNLKGSTVKVSGPCRIDGEIRKPALAEDEVKIVSLTDDKLIGVVRATRETVECDLASTAIDALPLLKDFSNTPVAVPALQPFQPQVSDEEVITLKMRTIRASGTCEAADGGTLAPFVDQDIEVISVERSTEDKSLIKISGIMKRNSTSVRCTNKSIRYSIVNQGAAPNAPQVVEAKKDLVGEIILISSTCFPDRRLPASKKQKIVFYPLVNARLQVLQTSYDDQGRLAYVSGPLIDNGAMVECDAAKFPISWKLFDPSSIKLQKIQTSDSATQEPAGDQSAPTEQ